jgi:hypothetical protein
MLHIPRDPSSGVQQLTFPKRMVLKLSSGATSLLKYQPSGENASDPIPLLRQIFLPIDGKSFTSGILLGKRCSISMPLYAQRGDV